MRTAVILGVSGQDGAYLARFLLDRNYIVHGTSRDPANGFPRLQALGIRDRVCIANTSSLRTLVESTQPSEIYNLSGLSSVAESFRDPGAAFASISGAHAQLLALVLDVAPHARVYHSASSECFGDLAFGDAADETTPFAPRSPYAEAKCAAHRATVDARDRGLFACSGIVFNHESPLRGEAFVTKKIVSAAASIANGSSNGKLHLGDVSASRDWGYAPEYVEAMWFMLQQDEPRDYVLATGESHTVEELAHATFAAFDLDPREHVVIDDSLKRRAEIRYNRGDASRAKHDLGWEARTKFHALIETLTSAARAGQ